MNIKTPLIAAATAVMMLTMSGCAVTRGQETVGAYVDDSVITSKVKASFIENKTVDASSISVETLKGTVLLSGFAKSWEEKNKAESLTRQVQGVQAVKNEITVRQ